MKRPGILILSQSHLLRLGLRQCINDLNFPAKLFLATDLTSAADLSSNNRIDIIIADEELRNNPELALLTTAGSPEYLFLTKENNTQPAGDDLSVFMTPVEIGSKIRALLITETDGNKTVADEKELSRREKEVVRLLALGGSNKDIAEKLSLSLHTVLTHRKNIIRKLGIKTAAGLTVYAILNGMITLEEANL